MLDLTKIYYFVVVAKYENLTEAARELHISQPALSKAIINLEEELGVNLFYRQGKRLYINNNGRFFMERANKLLAEVDYLKKELIENDGELQANLSVITTLPYSIMDLFSSFLDDYPNTKLKQVSLSKENLQDFIERGLHDLCITTEQIEHPNLEWIPLVEERIYLSVPKSHPFAERDSIDLMDLNDENLAFIGLLETFAFRKLTDEYCAQNGVTINYQIEVEESTAILHLVRSGHGVSFSPKYATNLYRDEIKHVLINDVKFMRTVGILKHKHYYQSKRAQAFLESAAAFFEEGGL